MWYKLPEFSLIPLEESEIESLKDGTDLEKALFKAIQKEDVSHLMKAIRKHWGIRYPFRIFENYLALTLKAKCVEGPFYLGGAREIIRFSETPEELFGVDIPDSKGLPMRWLRVGSSRYYGDIYVDLKMGWANAYAAEDLPFVFGELFEGFTKKVEQVSEKLLLYPGWGNDFYYLLEFQGHCHLQRLDSEDALTENLDDLAVVMGKLQSSKANIKRFLENRYFNFSKSDLKKVADMALG